ncbi:hypothetical protein GF412_05125 [Candidatus Micrarchaeota archaeon]|nr:hypothetical protein [Candidatus Micrarchaeota archaeon]MBD3418336.1 hypothetical protein [Candidatus Micrarchaeota archaeon]
MALHQKTRRRRGFSRPRQGYGFRSPLIGHNTPRITTEEAAKRLGIGPEALKKIFSARVDLGKYERYGKRGISILLNFDFGRKEVVMEGGMSNYSRIALPDVETLGKYLQLREQVRNRELIALSEAAHSRNPEPMKRMHDFVFSRLLLPPEADLPKVVFSRRYPGLRATVRRAGKTIYCEPRHGPGLVFAATLLEGTDYMRSRLIAKTRRELESFDAVSEIPFDFGFKLWIIDAFHFDQIKGLSRLLAPLACSRRVMDFRSATRKDYLEHVESPRKRVFPG